MRNAHPLQPDPRDADPALPPPGHRSGARFNVLLTEDRDRPDEHWTRQLPRLMAPLGVRAHVARSAPEALELHARLTFHAAIVDLATPAGAAGRDQLGGLWLLNVLKRGDTVPPVVVVNTRATRRQAVKHLNEALRLGAFSVVNPPVRIEQLLAAFQRVIERRYAGQWPAAADPPAGSPPPPPLPPTPAPS